MPFCKPGKSRENEVPFCGHRKLGENGILGQGPGKFGNFVENDRLSSLE